MVLAKRWTGAEAVALQDALRLSTREFARMLGVEPRTVTRWRAAGGTVSMRPFTAGSLDTALGRADTAARARFDALLAAPAAGLLPAGRADPMVWPADNLIDPDLRVWIQMHRRQLLRVFGSIPAVSMVLAGLDPAETDRVAKVLLTPGRVDARTVDHIDAALTVLRGQNHLHGPQLVLPMVTGQIRIAEALLGECPPALAARLHGIHGALCQLAGWMHFDLHRFADAATSYETARDSAHLAVDDRLAALVLCNLSYLVTWRGRPRLGIDHAVAAQQWARRTSDHRLRAYADDMAATAYSRDGQRSDCLTALHAADTALDADDNQPAGTVSAAYFAGRGLAASVRSDCLHQFGDGRDAKTAAEESLTLIDDSFARNKALAHLDLANALTDVGDIAAAAAAVADSAHLAATCRSDRLTERIGDTRAGLDRWTSAACVRELDELLDAYELSGSRT
jgi:hypothetical protein